MVSQVSSPKPTGTSVSVATPGKCCRGFSRDELEVGRLAANHDSERHEGEVPIAVCRRGRRDAELERAAHPDHVDLVIDEAGLVTCLKRPIEQPAR